nr:MAG TPA: hypothetical protein [Caudoviricetes sp.]
MPAYRGGNLNRQTAPGEVLVDALSDRGSTPLGSTKAEPDEPCRFAWLLFCSDDLYGQRCFRLGLPVQPCSEIRKAATAQFLCCVVAASFFVIAITYFVIFYQNPAEF